MRLTRNRIVVPILLGMIAVGMIAVAQDKQKPANQSASTSQDKVGLGPAVLALQDAAWKQIGLPGRPKGLKGGVERRLKLLAALPAIEKKVTKRAADYISGKGPGLEVGLVLDDGLYYSHGFGYRDKAMKNRPDESTLFRIDSQTKVFTGTALLTMIDDPIRKQNPATMMTLDDLAAKWVPDIKSVPGLNKVKLRHLVSHTSGLPNVLDPSALKGIKSPCNGIDDGTFIAALKKTSLLFTPGNLAYYSGVGTALVGAVLKRQSSENSYTGYVTNRLLKPLGMTHSTFDPGEIPADKLAQPYASNGGTSFTPLTKEWWKDPNWCGLNDALHPTGGLYTSLWDLSRFMQMWLAGKAPNDIIKPQTLQMATQSVICPPGKPPCPPLPNPVPDFCKNEKGENAYCGLASGFGVNWIIEQPLVGIQHAGATASADTASSSWTTLNLKLGLGATAFLSTSWDDDTLGAVWDLRNGAEAQEDKNEGWEKERLAVGVARLLWLMGANPPPGAGVPVKAPLPLPHYDPECDCIKGAKLPPGYVSTSDGKMMETEALYNYHTVVLQQFTPGALAQLGLVESKVEAVLSWLRAGNAVHDCSTFRVRAASDDTVSVRLQCKLDFVGQAYDATLTVEKTAPFRIAAISFGVTNDAY